MCENRKQVKDNWARIFEKKKEKGNCISVHIFSVERDEQGEINLDPARG